MKLIEILKAFEFVNPNLISDGGGVYSDVYQMGDEDAVELEAAILDFQATPKAEEISLCKDNECGGIMHKGGGDELGQGIRTRIFWVCEKCDKLIVENDDLQV